MQKAALFYALGLLVMLAGATSIGVDGVAAVAVVVVGLALFAVGIVVEERSDRS